MFFIGILGNIFRPLITQSYFQGQFNHSREATQWIDAQIEFLENPINLLGASRRDGLDVRP